MFGFYTISSLTKAYINPDDASKVILPGIVIFVAALVILIIAVLLMTNGIVKPVRKLIKYSESLSAGNTDFKIDVVGRKDEIGQLARAIREAQLSLKKVTMILDRASGDILKGNLSVRADASYYPGDFGRIMDNNNKIDDSICDIIRSIRDTAGNVASAAQQISTGSQQLSQGSSEQAAAIEEISATVTEILEHTRINADNAARTKELAETVNTEAKDGSEKMMRLRRALEDINSARPTSQTSLRSSRISPSRQISWHSTLPSKRHARVCMARALPSWPAKSKIWPKKAQKPLRNQAIF